jgi:ADP-ribosylglycohydrolase
MCNNIESKVCGSLMGVMIGDAMGMSVESMSYQSIKMMGGINGFRDSIQTKISDTKNLIAGTTTDDWQLSKAVAKSLIRRGKFDFTDQVLSHVSALEEKSVGWGKSIETGLMEVKSYLDSRGVHGRSPLDPVVYGENSGLGAGNGVAMKVAPYALGIGIHYLSGAINPNVREEYGKLFTQVRMIGELTHSYKSAIAGAYSFASIVLDNMIGYKKTCNDQDIDNLINKIELNIPHKYTHNNVLGEDNFMIQLNILKDKRLLFGDFEKLLMITGNNSTAMQ